MGYKLKSEDKEQVKKLLKPIDKKNKSGESLVYDAVYDKIKEARREEDQRLPQGVWKTNVKVADWGKVESLCLEALENRTKDLQIALWLTEAWVTSQGMLGLHKSVMVIKGIIDQFWETFYPQMNDGDAEYRVALLEWMNEKLPFRIQSIKVTDPQDPMDHDLQSYSLQNWVDASYHENIMRRGNAKTSKKAEKNPGVVTIEDFQKSQLATSTNFYKDLLEGANAVIEELTSLESILEKKIPDDMPSFHKLHSLLESIQHMSQTAINEQYDHEKAMKKAEKLEKEKPAKAVVESAPEKPAPAESVPAAAPAQSGAMTRESAYQQLIQIAAYIESVEPQSPAPHLIRRAVEWGNMSSAEFFATLAEANCDMNTVVRLLGLGKK